MRFKKGDKVVYIDRLPMTDEYKGWQLNKYETYEVINIACNKQGEIFYGVKDKKGTETTWFSEEDFIELKEYRKLKLEKLHEKLHEKFL